MVRIFAFILFLSGHLSTDTAEMELLMRCSYLRELKLGGNRLTTIQPSMVVSVLRNNEDSFMANELANNHWKCSCGLEDLWVNTITFNILFLRLITVFVF